MGDNSIHVTSARLKGIYRESICLKKDGWHVLANYITGYSIPPEIEGFIPDIYAIKEDRTSILMIEIQGDSDPERTVSFQKYTNEFANMFFETCLVNAAGSRIRIY